MDRILNWLLEGDRLFYLITVVGIPALMAFGGGWLVYKLIKMHRDERREWREDFGRVLSRMEELDGHQTSVIEGVTNALNGQNQMLATFMQVVAPSARKARRRKKRR